MTHRLGSIVFGALLLASAASASGQNSTTITLSNGATVPAFRAVVPARRVETPTIRRPTVIRRGGSTLICPPGVPRCIGPFPLDRVEVHSPAFYCPRYYGYYGSSYSGYYTGRSPFVLPPTLSTFPTSAVSFQGGSRASAHSQTLGLGGVLFSTRRYSTRQYSVMGPHQRPMRRTPRNLLR